MSYKQSIIAPSGSDIYSKETYPLFHPTWTSGLTTGSGVGNTEAYIFTLEDELAYNIYMNIMPWVSGRSSSDNLLYTVSPNTVFASVDPDAITNSALSALSGYDTITNAEFEARTLPSGSYSLEATSQLIKTDTGTGLPSQVSGISTDANVVLSSLSGYGVSKTSEVNARTLPSGFYSLQEDTLSIQTQVNSSPTISGIRNDLDTNSTIADRISKTPRADSTLTDGEAFQKSLNNFTDYISEKLRKTP